MQRVIEAEPTPIESLVPDAPLELQWIIVKALAKDPAERYQSSADVVVDLHRLRKQLDSGVTTPPRGYSTAVTAAAQKSAKQRWSVRAAVGILALVTTLTAAWYGWNAYSKRSSTVGPVSIRPLTSNGLVIDACISPDGKYLAYVESFEGKHALWLKQIATGSLIQLVEPAPVGYWGIAFAPDGSSIYYALKSATIGGGGALFRLPTLGGAPRRLLDGIDSAVSFSPDGTRMSYLRVGFPKPDESAVMVAHADGTDARALASKKPPEAFAPGFFVSTSWSRDGQMIYAPLRDARQLTWRVVTVDSTDGHEVPYGFPGNAFLQVGGLHVLPDETLLFTGALRQGPSARFGAGNEQIWILPPGANEPRPLTNDLSSYRAPHATQDGRAITAVSAMAGATVWELKSDGSDARRIVSSRLDGLSGLSVTAGGRLLFRSIEGGKADIWSMAADGTDRRQLTTMGLNALPVATPDGRTIVYLASRGAGVNVWRMDADGGNPRQLETIGASGSAPAISPDGRWVVFQSRSGGIERLWRVSIDGGTPALLTNVFAVAPAISPDGRWVAALSRGSQNLPMGIAILPFDGGPPDKLLPAEPSTIAMLRWAPDGKSLIHTAGGGRQTLYRQALDGSPAKPLVHYPEDQIFAFDIMKDGRIIMARGILARDAILVTNFR
jgi:Tol biopolymer transport system component